MLGRYSVEDSREVPGQISIYMISATRKFNASNEGSDRTLQQSQGNSNVPGKYIVNKNN